MLACQHEGCNQIEGHILPHRITGWVEEVNAWQDDNEKAARLMGEVASQTS